VPAGLLMIPKRVNRNYTEFYQRGIMLLKINCMICYCRMQKIIQRNQKILEKKIIANETDKKKKIDIILLLI